MSLLTLATPSSVLVLFLLGDVVVLKNGSEIQGEIIQDSPDRIVLKFSGGTLELPRKRVAQVKRQRHIDYLLEEGEKQLRRGSIEDAVATFREAVRESPTSVPARRALVDSQKRLAASLRDLGRYEEAVGAFRAIQDLDPAMRETVDEELKVISRILEDARKEEERGRKELSSGSLDQGVWRLLRVHGSFPGRRADLTPIITRAMIEQGDLLLRSQDWAQAEGKYTQALLLDPEAHPLLEGNLVEAKRRQIEPLLASGDFAAAERMVLEGLEVSPASKALRYYLGLCLEAKGQKRDAAEEYLSVSGVKRPADLEKSVRQLRLGVEDMLLGAGTVSPAANPHAREVLPGEFRRLTTEHFVVLHKNEPVARDVAMVAERSYSSVNKDLRCVVHLRNPIEITLFPTRDEYLRTSGLGSWSSGSHAVARRLGVLSSHRILSYQDQPCLTSAILPHEIAHALLAHRLNCPDEIPIWASEGYATFREPPYFQRHRRRIVAQELASKTLMPVRQVLSNKEYPSERVDLFYAQSFSLVEFLVSLKGVETLVGFLKEIAAHGANLDEALWRHYRIAGSAALENRWLGWFEQENT